ncbi:MAG: biotin/lipoyl-containing protein, partial [Acidobacteriota bacterium]
MSVEIVMPQMGESITEGTVSKWLKAVGDKIEKDEAILEISTDKVDAEVPSPGAGVLLEIRHNEGETVEVGTVLAVIGAEGETPAASDNGNTKANAPAVEIAAAKIDEPPTPALLVNAARDNDQPVEMPPANTPPSAPAGDATEIVMPQMGES